MSKRKSTSDEMDDEFFARLDFLRNDYDQALETIDQQNADIRRLLALLIKISAKPTFLSPLHVELT